MSDIEEYIFCAVFFVLGIFLTTNIMIVARRDAVNKGRMMIKSGDTWKGTISAAVEIADQFLPIFNRVVQKTKENKNGNNPD